MSKAKPVKMKPAYWGLLVFIVAQALLLVLASSMNPFLEEQNIHVPSQPSEPVTWWPGEVTLPSGEVIEVSPYSSLLPIIIYFAVVVAVLSLVLSVIPLRMLKMVLRAVFAMLFAWGAFIATVFYIPYPLAVMIGVAVGAAWFFMPVVWLHNVALVVALVSLAAVFGRFITPWTAMLVVLALAIYDFIAVRFGFMLWMADKLARSDTLPAIIIPRAAKEWGLNLRHNGVTDLLEPKPYERQYSILGGGDIAFPCLLAASVYFAQGLNPALVIAAFGFLGLAGAYIIQAVFVKGKAVPALPPIAALTVIGLLIIQGPFGLINW